MVAAEDNLCESSAIAEVGSGRRRPRRWVPYAILFAAPFAVFWRLWTPNPADRAFIWQDVTDTVYPFFVFLTDAISRYHETPRWAWGIYSGMPFSATFFNFLLYPPNLLFYIGALDPAHQGIFHVAMIAHLSVAGVLFYCFARSFHIRPEVALLGALVYTFGGFTNYMLIVGHAWFVVHAWTPLALLCIRKFVITSNLLWCFGLCGAVFLIASSLMPLLLVPVMYFLLLFLVASLYIEGKSAEWPHIVACASTAIVVAFALHAVEILPIIEFSFVSPSFNRSAYLYTRDKWGEQSVLRFLQEFFIGGDLAKPYLSQAAAAAVVVSLWLRRGRYWFFWSAAFVVSTVAFFWSRDLALFDFFYVLVPGFKLLPSVDRGGIGLIYTLSAAFLTMTALASLGALRRHIFQISIAFSVAIALVWMICKPADGNASVSFRNSFASSAAVTALLLLLIAALNRPRPRRAVMIAAGALFAVAVVSVGSRNLESRFLSFADRTKPPLQNADPLSEAGVFSESPYLNGRAAKPKLPSIDTPRRYRPRDNVALLQGPDNVAGYYQFAPLRIAQAFAAGGFSDNYLFRGPAADVIDRKARWSPAAVTKLYNLPGSTRGRAWLLTRFEVVQQPPFSLMLRPDFDPYALCFLEPEGRIESQEFARSYQWIYPTLQRLVPRRRATPSAAMARPINSDLTLVRQTVNSAAFRLERDVHRETLFFSDCWYPGWTAYLNGTRLPLYIGNYAFKAVVLDAPKGSIVEFVFDPPIVKVGALVSVVVLLSFLLCVVLVVRKAKPQTVA